MLITGALIMFFTFSDFTHGVKHQFTLLLLCDEVVEHFEWPKAFCRLPVLNLIGAWRTVQAMGRR